MARKPPSRLQKRREVEAAASRAPKEPKELKAKKPAKPRVSARKRAKAAERKRLIWGLFSSTLKEEARFPYDQRQQAEERLEQLLAKGKRAYFIQPIKEVIADVVPRPVEEPEDEPTPVRKRATRSVEEVAQEEEDEEAEVEEAYEDDEDE